MWSKAHVATFLHAPADLEVHRGNDGRIYVLDTARVFPPVVPTRKKKGEHLYQMFRPEFVKLNPVPLSSDAFSWFAGNINIPEVKANNDVSAIYHSYRIRSISVLFGLVRRLWI